MPLHNLPGESVDLRARDGLIVGAVRNRRSSRGSSRFRAANHIELEPLPQFKGVRAFPCDPCNAVSVCFLTVREFACCLQVCVLSRVGWQCVRDVATSGTGDQKLCQRKFLT